MRKIHLFGATWDLLLDPVTWCFLVGGMVLLAWRAQTGLPRGGQLRPWGCGGPQTGVSSGPVAAVAAALLAALYLDNVLHTDYDAPLDAMKLLWNPWVLLALLAVAGLAGLEVRALWQRHPACRG